MRALVLIALIVASSPLDAQRTVTTATSVRATRDGRALGEVRTGARVAVLSSGHGWSQVQLEGWIRRDYVGPKRDSFALTVDGDEVILRAAADRSSRAVARLANGMGFHRVATSGQWVQVKRAVWVTSGALGPEARTSVAAAKPAPASPPSKPQAVATARGEVASSSAADSRPPVDSGRSSSDTTKARPDSAREDRGKGFALVRKSALAAGPNEASVGLLDSAAHVETLARDGAWVKVRTEGWVREADLVPADASGTPRITAADLRADPDRYRGQVVRWDVQVISLQTADALRKGMATDEPYLLARGPDASSSLMYLALPPPLVEAARALPPLSRVVITARVRAGRSEPSGVPLLDVQSLTRR